MNISFAKLGCEECEICDEHKIHMGFTDNEKKEKFDMLKTCESKCEKCTSLKDHYAKYRETWLAYKEDKNLVGNCENTCFCPQTEKDILLPRLPGYKVRLFTKRIVVINQSFAPINKEEVRLKKSLGFLWQEGISGRNDEDVTSAFFGAMEFRDFDNYVIWLDGLITVLDRIRIGHFILP